MFDIVCIHRISSRQRLDCRRNAVCLILSVFIEFLVHKFATRWRNITIRRRAEKTVAKPHTPAPPGVRTRVEMTETSIALVKSLMSSLSMWSLRPQACRSPPTVSKVIQDNGADMSRWGLCGLWGFVWIVEICVGCVFFLGGDRVRHV